MPSRSAIEAIQWPCLQTRRVDSRLEHVDERRQKPAHVDKWRGSQSLRTLRGLMLATTRWRTPSSVRTSSMPVKSVRRAPWCLHTPGLPDACRKWARRNGLRAMRGTHAADADRRARSAAITRSERCVKSAERLTFDNRVQPRARLAAALRAAVACDYTISAAQTPCSFQRRDRQLPELIREPSAEAWHTRSCGGLRAGPV